MHTFNLPVGDREKLIDELIAGNQDSTVRDYLRELAEIEDEINSIQNESIHT